MLILLNESNASRRCVPIMCFQSNGTSACTNESGRTFMFSIGGVFYGSGGSISAVSSVDGAYMANFSASKVSVLGHGMVHYSSNTALPWMTPFQVVPIDSFDSMRLGLFALPNAAAEAAGGLITFGTGTGQMHTSSGSVGLKAQTHSQATVGGADNLGRREYSDVTVRIGLVDYSGATLGINNIKPAAYSGVSVEVTTGGIQVASVGKGAYSGVSVEVTTGGIQVASVGKGSYSGVSVEVKTGGIQTASVGIGSYSGVSVEVKTGGIQTTSIGLGSYSGVTLGIDNIKPASYSGVTVGIDNIKPLAYSGVSVEVTTGGIQAASLGAGTLTSAKFAASAIDAAALATDAGQEIADRILGRNLAGSSDGGRTVTDALRVLRNRVQIQGSTGTVFQENDTSSAWTFQVVSLATLPLGEIDPGGP